MVTPATTAAMPGQQTAAPASGGKAQAAPPPPPTPFTRGAHRHNEGAFNDQSQVVDANLHAKGPIDVPAYGYLRSIVLIVTATGGAHGGNTVAAAADAPWNVLQNVQLVDVNGAPLFGPFTNGYNLYLANKYGAYEWAMDPTLSPFFSNVDTNGDFQFLLRIPVEITARDGLGSLPNQNAASTYKLSYSVAPSSTLYTTPPATTLPTVRVQCFLEAWSQPLPTDLRGMPQATVPPALGTTQYWSSIVPTISSGQQTVRCERVGNLIRMLLLVVRDNTGARANALFPDPVQILWDTRILYQEARALRQQYVFDAYNYGLGDSAQDAGVFVYQFADDLDGHAGDELRNLYLPTTQATRLEVQGVFGANATTLEIITNDVAPTADIAVS